MTDQSAPTKDHVLTSVTTSPAPMKPDAALWVATKALLWPWKRGSFRGWSVEAGEALGYVPGTLRAWDQKSSRGIGKPAIDRIATLLESRAAQSSELARAWRAHAATLPDNYPVPWFRKSRLLEKDGWRSKPRK